MECPICSGIMTAVPQRLKQLALLRCQACGFLGADLKEWSYPYADQDYYASIDPETINPERCHIRHRVEQICRFVDQGRVVDLGCGLGETAIALGRAGFKAHGVEESENAVTFLQQNYSEVCWHNSGIAPFLKEQRDVFNVITMYHVLEHIPRPRGVCQLVVDALKVNGLLVVEVPDVSGGQARLRGQRWQHWLPHHVNYFTTDTLKRLLIPLGLKFVGMEPKYHLTFPQGIGWRDAIHGTLARLGLHDIITTYWRKSA